MKIIPFTVSQKRPAGYRKANMTDKDILMGIMNHDEATIGIVYRHYYQSIQKMVYTFRNTILDPDDIFQEGLTRAIINIRNGRFRGESSFLTYLNGICRNICLKELDRKSFDKIGNRDFPEEGNWIDFEALNLLLEIRNRLEEKCRTIIDLRFGLGHFEKEENPSFEEIAGTLGITPDNARQRFKRCLDKLRGYVKDNAELQDEIFL